MSSRTGGSSSRRKTIILRTVLLLAATALMLVAVNGAQYFRIQGNLARALISRLNNLDLQRLAAFFDNTENTLLTTRDWGKNGLLSLDDPRSLNSKFIPIIEHTPLLTAIILADSRGRQYYLRRGRGGAWEVRRVEQRRDGAVEHVEHWKDVETMLDSSTRPTAYDPRKRPWFKDVGETVRWTDVYTFYSDGMPGITASICWKAAGGEGLRYVMAMDFGLESLAALLQEDDVVEGQIPFIYNPATATLFTDRDKAVASEAVRAWEKAGRPAGGPLSFRFQDRSWDCSLKLVRDSEPRFYYGLVMSEQALRQAVAQEMLSFDFLDAAVLGLGLLGLVLALRPLLRAHGGREASPRERFLELAAAGEGAGVEFKSTLRMNLKSGKPGKEIELACLKTIAAFLNSEGGTLLIGVNDQGEVIGLEADGFDNPDRWGLHFKNIVNQHIGPEFAGNVHLEMVDFGDRFAAMVTCAPARDPVFVRLKKNEEFYIRSGPATTRLSPSQTVNYLKDRMSRTR